MNSITSNVVLLLLFFVKSWAGASDTINVVTSASIFADMIKNVGGDWVHVKSIIPIGSDPHSYELKPNDITLLTQADLIMLNGLNLEVWLTKVVKNLKIEDEKIVILTHGVRSINSTTYTNSIDPHAWMTTQNGLIYINNIYKALAKKIKSDTGQLQLNNTYENYKNELLDLDKKVKTKIASLPSSSKKLVTAHDAFQYFGEYYGLELYALQGISPEADIRIVDFLRIVNLIKALNIPAIFAESTINPKIIEKIAYTARCSVGDKLYADSLSDQDGPAASYLSMIDYNVHTIVNALLLEYNGQKLIEDALQPTTILMLFMTILVMMLSFLYLMCK